MSASSHAPPQTKSCFLCRFFKSRNNAREKDVQGRQGQTTTLQSQLRDQDASGKPNPDTSVPTQASTKLQSQTIGHSSQDEGKDMEIRGKRNPDISLPTQTSTTLQPQSIGHSPRDEGKDVESRGKRNFDIPLPTQASTSLQPQTIISGHRDSPRDEGKDVESRGKRNPDISVPTQAPTALQPQTIGHSPRDEGKEASTVTTEPYPTVCSRNRDMKTEGAPSNSIGLFPGSSNFQISNTNINAICGNATFIRFGDGQFTEIQRNLICDYIANLTKLPDIDDKLKKHALTQSIIALPRAEAVFNDYQTKKKSGPCFKGTRKVLLREMASWITGPGQSRMYVLSGLAGLGKSTVAYTIASRAADLNLLGASFFFSRDEADRKNAKKFFTTIAYQLCVYDETFAKAIGDVLLERGSAATTKSPQEQLEALIVNPLKDIVKSRVQPILVVVDALDECDEDDEPAVVAGLSQLVRLLRPFRVILTTRPQSLDNQLFGNHDGHEIFYLQNIEDNVVDGDIRLYLFHSLSREQVKICLPNAWEQWSVSDEDLQFLVQAVGRLFLIASTAVRFILDKFASDPAAQMGKLLRASAQNRMAFKNLSEFYIIILRDVVPNDCDDDDIVDRYQAVIGAILVVQHPLPVKILACLIDRKEGEIRAVLNNLQSVILHGSDDIPRIYHNSFSDYLTDPACCKDTRLRIDPKAHHMRMTTRCFDIMDKHLKSNILNLCDPARFMDNEDGFKEDGITNEQLQEKIPQQLRYTCVYWANHLEVTNIQDAGLMKQLENFAYEHLLHWFEVLSLIGELDLAHRAILSGLKLLSMSSELHRLFSDALRFISTFYDVIKQSALHTYYSALPFTPTESLLYRRYIKKAVHNVCGVDGGPERWDALIANLNYDEYVQDMKFSLDGPSSKEQPTLVTALALSPDCSRLAFGFENGTVELWETSPTKRQITSPLTGTLQPLGFNSSHRDHTEMVWTLGFGPDGRSFASGSNDGTIKLWNGGDGTLRGTLEAPRGLQAVAVSNTMLAAGWHGGVTVWTLGKPIPIHTFKKYGDIVSGVSIAENNGLVAATIYPNRINLLDIFNRTTIATFRLPHTIYTTLFLPDNSHVVVQSDESDFYSVNPVNKQVVEGPALEHLIKLPNVPRWHGVPIWYNKKRHYLAALFPHHQSPVSMLWIPRTFCVVEWTQGSSMISLRCEDGHIIVVRLPASHVS